MNVEPKQRPGWMLQSEALPWVNSLMCAGLGVNCAMWIAEFINSAIYSSNVRILYRIESTKIICCRRFPTHYGQVCCYDDAGHLMQTSYQPVIKVTPEVPYNPGFPMRAYEFGTAPYMGQYEVAGGSHYYSLSWQIVMDMNFRYQVCLRSTTTTCLTSCAANSRISAVKCSTGGDHQAVVRSTSHLLMVLISFLLSIALIGPSTLYYTVLYCNLHSNTVI